MIQEEINTDEQLNSSQESINKTESNLENDSGTERHNLKHTPRRYYRKRREKSKFEKFLSKPELKKNDFFIPAPHQKIIKKASIKKFILDKIFPIIESLILLTVLAIFFIKYYNNIITIFPIFKAFVNFSNENYASSNNNLPFDINTFLFYFLFVILLLLPVVLRNIKSIKNLISIYFIIILLFLIYNIIVIKDYIYVPIIIKVILFLIISSIYWFSSNLMNNKWSFIVAYFSYLFYWKFCIHYLPVFFPIEAIITFFLINLIIIYISIKQEWEIIIYPIFSITIIYILLKTYGSFLGLLDLPVIILIIFIILSYFLFTLPILMSIIKSSKILKLRNLILLVCITIILFFEGLFLLYNITGFQFFTIYSLVFGLYNIFILLFLYKSKIIENTVIFLLFSLLFIIFSVTFLALDYRIFIFCCLSSFTLLRLSKIYQHKKFVMASIYSLFTAMLIIFFFWIHNIILPFLNNDSSYINNQFMQVCALSIFSIATLNLNLRLFVFIKKFLARIHLFQIIDLKPKDYRILLRWLIIIALYFSLFCLVYYIIINFIDINIKLNGEWWYTYTALFAIFLFYYTKKYKRNIKNSALIICFLFTLFYPFIIHPINIILRNDYLLSGFPVGYFLYHYINLIITFIIFYLSYHFLKSRIEHESFLMRVFLFYISVFLVFIALTEFDNISLLAQYSQDIKITNILGKNTYLGYSLIILTFSLLYLIIGLIKNIFILRIVSVGLFVFSLIKFLFYDINTNSEEIDITKMGLYFFLGILILFLSFGSSKVRGYFKKLKTEETDTKSSHSHRRMKHRKITDSWKKEDTTEQNRHHTHHHSGHRHK